MSTDPISGSKGPLRRRVAGAFLLLAILALFPALPHSSDRAPKPPISVRVVRIIDGDTIEVCCIGWKRESVRYIGINTPETHHTTKAAEAYGKEAVEANRKLVAGKTVRLEFDVRQRDQHGRLLAYVYLEDGRMVNAWLVEQGYAQVKLEREARRGLWR